MEGVVNVEALFRNSNRGSVGLMRRAGFELCLADDNIDKIK